MCACSNTDDERVGSISTLSDHKMRKVAPFFGNFSPLIQNHTPSNLQPVWVDVCWKFNTLWTLKCLVILFSMLTSPQREPWGGSKGPGGSCDLFNKFISKHFLFFSSFFSEKRNLFWLKKKQNRVKISHFNYTKKKKCTMYFFVIILEINTHCILL